MTDKSDVAGRLRARADEQERNNSYPVDRALDREAADEIDRLTAALASERERAEKAERERSEADKKYRETLSLLNDSMAICWGTGMDAIAHARRVTELEGALEDAREFVRNADERPYPLEEKARIRSDALFQRIDAVLKKENAGG